MANPIDRSHDLADMIVKIQQSTEEPVSDSGTRYFGTLEENEVSSVGEIGSTGGPPYYAT
jgi:hypothetical protein